MFSVGLTGGIASGKTTVSDLFAQRGPHPSDGSLDERVVEVLVRKTNQMRALFDQEDERHVA